MGVGNRLFDDILGPLQAALAEAGEDLVVTYLDDDADEVRAAIDYQHARRPKAMVFLGGEPRYFREAFHEVEVPSVLVTSSAADLGLPNLSSVSIDNEAASRHVIERLLARGHRRIGVIGGSHAGNLTSDLRLRGAERALAEHGVALDLERDYEPAPFLETGGYDAASRLLSRSGDLTAIFALGDVVAFRALRAIVDRGLARVPGDVSLVGFDDTSFSQFSVPRVTTNRASTRSFSPRARPSSVLRGMAGGEAEHVVVPFELMERESVRTL